MVFSFSHSVINSYYNRRHIDLAESSLYKDLFTQLSYTLLRINMSRYRKQIFVCDMCGTETENRLPQEWIDEIVWKFTESVRLTQLSHVAHDHDFSRVSSHLCGECTEGTEGLILGFNNEVEEKFCSWCGSPEVISILGSAAEGYTNVNYGICMDCSPFEK